MRQNKIVVRHKPIEALASVISLVFVVYTHHTELHFSSIVISMTAKKVSRKVCGPVKNSSNSEINKPLIKLVKIKFAQCFVFPNGQYIRHFDRVRLLSSILTLNFQSFKNSIC